MNEVESIWSQIVEGAFGASPAEQFATVLGVAGVWLMMKRSLWSFPAGLVQVAIFGWVCFHGGLYSETVLQGMFFVALAYGWWHWTRGTGEAELPITRLTARERLAWMSGGVALWICWGVVMTRLGAALAWADAFVFAVSVLSQILQSRKVLENWLGWLVANLIAVGVFWVKEFYWFSVLYAIFAFMAWGGLREWTRAMRGQSSLPEAKGS